MAPSLGYVVATVTLRVLIEIIGEVIRAGRNLQAADQEDSAALVRGFCGVIPPAPPSRNRPHMARGLLAGGLKDQMG